MSSRCSCLNGGRCLDAFVQACSCPAGFFGTRCQDVEMEFVQGKKSEDNVEMIIIVSLFLVLLIVSTAVCFFTWRRSRSKKRKERQMSKLRNRRQSKATIEGVTYPGLSKDFESDDHSLKSILIVSNNGEAQSTIVPVETTSSEISKSKSINHFVAFS